MLYQPGHLLGCWPSGQKATGTSMRMHVQRVATRWRLGSTEAPVHPQVPPPLLRLGATWWDGSARPEEGDSPAGAVGLHPSPWVQVSVRWEGLGALLGAPSPSPGAQGAGQDDRCQTACSTRGLCALEPRCPLRPSVSTSWGRAHCSDQRGDRSSRAWLRKVGRSPGTRVPTPRLAARVHVAPPMRVSDPEVTCTLAEAMP